MDCSDPARLRHGCAKTYYCNTSRSLVDTWASDMYSYHPNRLSILKAAPAREYSTGPWPWPIAIAPKGSGKGQREALLVPTAAHTHTATAVGAEGSSQPPRRRELISLAVTLYNHSLVVDECVQPGSDLGRVASAAPASGKVHPLLRARNHHHNATSKKEAGKRWRK